MSKSPLGYFGRVDPDSQCFDFGSKILDNLTDHSVPCRISLWRSDERPVARNNGRFLCLCGPKRRANAESRLLFSKFCFSTISNEIIGIDDCGRVFLLDITLGNFSYLHEISEKCTALSFSTVKPSQSVWFLANKSMFTLDTDSRGAAKPVFSLIPQGPKSPHSRRINAVNFHLNWNIALTVSTDTVVIWDTTTWKKKQALGGAEGIADAKFTPKGDLILVAYRYSGIHGWGASSLEYLVRLNVKRKISEGGRCDEFVSELKTANTLNCFCVSYDSRYVVAGSRSNEIFVWDLPSKNLIRSSSLPLSVSDIVQIEFLPQSLSVAALGDDGAVRIVRVIGVKNITIESEIVHDTGAFLNFAISPFDSSIMAAGTSDGKLTLYDLKKAEKYYKKSSSRQHKVDVVIGPQEESAVSSKPRSTFPTRVKASKLTNPMNEKPVNKKLVPKVVRYADLAAYPKTFVQEKQKIEKPINSDIVSSTQDRKIDIADQTKSKTRLLGLAGSINIGNLQISEGKLLKLLDANGEFPARHRSLIWRFLLRLPEDFDKYTSLLRNGPTAAFGNLESRYPVRNRAAAGRFKRVLAAFVSWDPGLKSAHFFPALVYPIVNAFGTNELAAFETIAALLTHMCNDWFDQSSKIPIASLKRIDRVLSNSDPKLSEHLLDYDLTSVDLSWPILRSLFSEVLIKENWLKLWDNLIGRLYKKPRLVEAMCVTYFKLFRQKLLGLHDRMDILSFARESQDVNMKEWIERATKLHDSNANYFNKKSRR